MTRSPDQEDSMKSMDVTVFEIVKDWGTTHKIVDALIEQGAAQARGRSALQTFEARLLGKMSDGTYVAPHATFTAQEIRESIWSAYDTESSEPIASHPEHSYEAIRTDIISALTSDGFAHLEADQLVRIYERHLVSSHAFTQVTDEDRCACGLPIDAPQHSQRHDQHSSDA